MNPPYKKVLISGVQPSGRSHIGNYFGAMKQFVDLQDKYESFFFIPDYHALTSLQDAALLRENVMSLALDYLAIGIDPEKAVIFKQSDVPEHTELAWIFNCITSMPFLMRAHAFKDAEAKNHEINVGRFDYPLLMAADILIYDSEVVPVGKDQKQHVEIAQDTQEKFNHVFGEVFKRPEPLILPEVETVPGIDGQKMSKSYKNTIPLFASNEEIAKAVMSIVTDSASGVPTNVYNIHKLFRGKTELDVLYEEKKGKYKDLKDALIADLIVFIAPLRERREALAKDPAYVLSILEKGAHKARARAQAKMKIVREKVGLSY